MDGKNKDLPIHHGFRQLAEFSQQKGIWLAWPSDASLWLKKLKGAQQTVLELAQVIQESGVEINLLTPNSQREKEAKEEFHKRKISANFFLIPFGDIWIRDIGPIFLGNSKKELATVCFQFNGWGEKYIL